MLNQIVRLGAGGKDPGRRLRLANPAWPARRIVQTHLRKGALIMSIRWIWIVAMSAGLLSAVACSSMHHKEKEEAEGNEVKMKFAEVPQPVQKTLTEQARGASIGSVDKEMSKGKVVYETD